MSSNRARYGIVASPPIFSILPGMQSGFIDFLSPYHCQPFPNNANFDGEGFYRVDRNCYRDVLLGAEDRNIIVV
jgi:hypothetical protein